MNDILLYKKVSCLKDRLEMGHEFTSRQIEQAIEMVNKINQILDRRRGGSNG